MSELKYRPRRAINRQLDMLRLVYTISHQSFIKPDCPQDISDNWNVKNLMNCSLALYLYRSLVYPDIVIGWLCPSNNGLMHWSSPLVKLGHPLIDVCNHISFNGTKQHVDETSLTSLSKGYFFGKWVIKEFLK